MEATIVVESVFKSSYLAKKALDVLCLPLFRAISRN